MFAFYSRHTAAQVFVVFLKIRSGTENSVVVVQGVCMCARGSATHPSKVVCVPPLEPRRKAAIA